MPTYIIEQGDYLSKIAKAHGVRDWTDIYQHPNNAAFKEKYPNPNVIYPGEELFIPSAQGQGYKTGEPHTIVFAEPKLKLKLSVSWPYQNEKLTGKRYNLKVEGTVFNDSIPGSAIIEHDIPAAAETAQLTVWRDDNTPHTWTLNIGHLDPVDTVTGQQARLNNLGFPAGSEDGNYGSKTRQAVQQFQERYDLTVDGICGPKTQAKLEEVYGC